MRWFVDRAITMDFVALVEAENVVSAVVPMLGKYPLSYCAMPEPQEAIIYVQRANTEDMPIGPKIRVSLWIAAGKEGDAPSVIRNSIHIDWPGGGI